MRAYLADVAKKHGLSLIGLISIASSTARNTIARKIWFKIIPAIDASWLAPFIAVIARLKDDLLELLQGQFKSQPSFSRLTLVSHEYFFRVAQTARTSNYAVEAEGTASAIATPTFFFFMRTLCHVSSPGTFWVPSRILHAPLASPGCLKNKPCEDELAKTGLWAGATCHSRHPLLSKSQKQWGVPNQQEI